MYHKCRKVNFKLGGLYIDYSNWIKKKKSTINKKKNTDDKCSQHAVTVALSYEKIKWNPSEVLNIKY